MFGYFVLTRENILLSSRFSALKICQIYCHCHTLLKLSIHSFRHPACEIVVAFRLSDDACLRHLPVLLYCVYGRCMEERDLHSLGGGFPVVQTALN